MLYRSEVRAISFFCMHSRTVALLCFAILRRQDLLVLLLLLYVICNFKFGQSKVALHNGCAVLLPVICPESGLLS